MREHIFAVAIVIVANLSQADARADHAPVYVVPGRPEVPVMIDGQNAAWGVVEGDWGLYRPGAVAVTVVPSPYAARRRAVEAAPYFPSFGVTPLAGRHEIAPPADRIKPPRAERHEQFWFSESEPLPATDNEQNAPMVFAPVIEPRFEPRRRPRR